MINEINVKFGEGKKLTAISDSFTINTDQSEADGGDGTAPTPLELFLASLATCAAHYARSFCDSRSISMDGMGLKVEYDFNKDAEQITSFRYQMTLPEGFPEKYKAALLRAIDLCTVKKHLMNPPAFELEIV
ncbi:OsmC family protein [Maridesulfovibrio hydrothermalis]|uniref:OsmC family protein n=1 Tax=Maridesulfovibrio hydrothermalis AM13 = DSM 14728 TaxID=1121451 RepID=L0RFQ8_9BACT|nr:OsmC family protein [Maridesulfovibrio hydrothermalis]CCO25062.1 OsmC family protein [Maridesulfovibrio hydrothermalis AM13 = DSM 14728]